MRSVPTLVKVLFFALLALLVFHGRGASDPREGQLIEMEHYSLTLLDAGEWTFERPRRQFDPLLLKREVGEKDDPTLIQIRFYENTVTKKRFVKKSGKWHAENIFGAEQRTMQQQGVDQGLYELHGLSTGEEDVAGKHYFFMAYEAETANEVMPSALYLHFPRESHNEWFLMAHYSQVVPKPAGLREPARASLREVLGTLEIGRAVARTPAKSFVASPPTVPHELDEGPGADLTGRWRSLKSHTIKLLEHDGELLSGRTVLAAEKARAGYAYSYELERQEDGSFLGVVRGTGPCLYPDSRGNVQTLTCTSEEEASLKLVTPSRLEFESFTTHPRALSPGAVRRFCKSNCKDGTKRKQSVVWVREDADRSAAQLGGTALEEERLNPRVFIQGDEFLMGRLAGPGLEGQYPQHRVRVASFWMQRHEVTNEEFNLFRPQHGFGMGLERFPAVSVSWNEAQAYAEWLGGSLPTEAQWEFAARGPGGREYPWGDEEPNCGRANFRDCGRLLKPVGSHPEGATPEGVEDLAGSVWEWCADWYAPYEMADQVDPSGPASGNGRVLRGGSYNEDGEMLHAGARYGDYAEAGRADYGFRVVWPAPEVQD